MISVGAFQAKLDKEEEEIKEYEEKKSKEKEAKRLEEEEAERKRKLDEEERERTKREEEEKREERELSERLEREANVGVNSEETSSEVASPKEEFLTPKQNADDVAKIPKPFQPSRVSFICQSRL